MDHVKEPHPEVYWRFNAFHRFLHLVMAVTFTGLALTGLPLKYAGAFWAEPLVSLLGGVRGAGLLHRWLAAVTFGYFFLHLLWFAYYRFVLKGDLFGPDSMMPTRKDFRDLREHIAYFLGKGAPPRFGRFAYWEKFDYWAVFWGIAFIGGSGLLLWFPEFFSKALPGIVFNIAYTIHSDEALLATGFIFVVHLYNAHFRHDVFPLDRSIFTGKISDEEMKHRHPLEWEDLEQHPEKKARRRVRADLLLLLLVVLGTFLPSLSETRGLTDEEIREQEKKLCWKCHRRPNLNSNEGAASSTVLCMDCHEKKEIKKEVDGRAVSLYVDEKEFGKTIHRRIPCIRCHEGIAASPHRTSRIECVSCHGYHGEGTAHDPHRTVNCEACHHESKAVRKDPKTGRIVLSNMADGKPLVMTSHRLADFSDRKACEKCHAAGNRVGAPITVLPAKSIICIGCHSSSPGSMDPITFVTLFFWALGVVIIFTYWFRGSLADSVSSSHEKIAYLGEKLWQIFFSRKILVFLKISVIDILFLRRILKESLSRWTIHSLIYLPFFLRFLIGLILLFLSKVFPASEAVASLLDKNHGGIAFIYDLLGLCVMIGITGAMMRRFREIPHRRLTSSHDIAALSLLGSILITGFLMEGMRILLTGIPAPVGLASFLGYPISLFFGLFPVRWELVYPYGWYIHAVLTGMFIAYLPFSKMFHILVSPIVLWINALTEEE